MSETSATSSAGAAEAVPAKRRQILAGARQVFGELGFERASVDLIAARAGVSKATVYNHYEDKKALFVACVVQEADEMRSCFRTCLGDSCGDVEQVLQMMGERVMGIFLSPVVVNLYRHAIAAAHFADLGQTIFDRGPGVIHAAIAAYLEGCGRAGTLRVEDPRTAAVQFVALCQGDLVSRSRLGILAYPVEQQIRENVQRAVRTFVRAYRP
jgi:TetR/AcrR family transcriptional regulator, mexJK operon transcriptional repressor